MPRPSNDVAIVQTYESVEYSVAGLLDRSCPTLTRPSAKPYLVKQNINGYNSKRLRLKNAHNFVQSGRRPRQRGDRRALSKFVTNRLLVTPFDAQFVHKNNFVALCDRKLRRVRRKLHRSYQVRLWFLVGRFRREFIGKLALVVEEPDDAVKAASRQFAMVRREANRCNLGGTAFCAWSTRGNQCA